MKSEVEEDFRDAAKHFSVANQVRGRKWEMCGLVSVAWKNSELCRGALFLLPIDLVRYVAAAGGSRPGSALATRSNSYASLTGIGQEIADVTVNETPVKVTVKHANRLVHDFGKGPAVVPVDIYVKNETGRLVDVSVTAAPHEQIADGCRGRYWTGDVSMSLRALPPGACRYVMLTAVLERPGCYDMAKIVVKWAVMNCAKKKSVVPLKASFVEVVRGGAKDSSGAWGDMIEIGGRDSVDLEEDVLRRARLGLRR